MEKKLKKKINNLRMKWCLYIIEEVNLIMVKHQILFTTNAKVNLKNFKQKNILRQLKEIEKALKKV